MPTFVPTTGIECIKRVLVPLLLTVAARLERRIDTLAAELASVRTELRADMAEVRRDLHAEGTAIRRRARPGGAGGAHRRSHERPLAPGPWPLAPGERQPGALDQHGTGGDAVTEEPRTEPTIRDVVDSPRPHDRPVGTVAVRFVQGRRRDRDGTQGTRSTRRHRQGAYSRGGTAPRGRRTSTPPRRTKAPVSTTDWPALLPDVASRLLGEPQALPARRRRFEAGGSHHRGLWITCPVERVNGG